MQLNRTEFLGRRTWISAALLALVLMAPCHCLAQEQQYQTLSSTLFHKPTFNNGYEEFVQAVDLAHTVPGANQAMEPGATLTVKRKVANSQQVRDVLDLIKEGLQKPVRSPRTILNETTTFPELAGFRQIARLMGIKIYVDCADGHVGTAIDTLKLGLEFSNRVQIDTLIAGLVGIAIESIVEKSFALHLDQLSYFDCDALLQLALEMLHEGSPATRIFAYETSFQAAILERNRANMSTLTDILDDEEDDGTINPTLRALIDRLTAHPEELSAAITSVQGKVKQNYSIASDNVNLPVDKRKPYLKDTANSLDAMLFNAVSIEPGTIVDRYSISRSKLCLLALHALIHKYRWEHAVLPGSLDELHRPDLTLDPMAGKPFTYVVKGDTYTLTGVGPFNRDENGEQLNQRGPLTLP